MRTAPIPESATVASRVNTTLLTDDMLARFAERAPVYDAENRFAAEDFQDLRDAGYLLLNVPQQFGGYGRVATDDRGRFRFDTIKPGAVPGPGGRAQAPHVLVSLLAPGILTRYWTRLYFDDEPSNATDPVLERIPQARRATLLARTAGEGRYEFDIVVQGPNETVFLEE